MDWKARWESHRVPAVKEPVVFAQQAFPRQRKFIVIHCQTDQTLRKGANTMKKFSVLGIAVLLLALLLLGTSPAYATTTCTFTTTGKTMKLDADCTTDATIFIPNGFTLNGNGHTITGIDPPGDHFRGAVVQNGGATANVRNLTVTVSGLANVCDNGVDRLRGILFEGASGSIMNSKALNINQGASGCQEGNGIEARNEPFDGTHPATKVVKILNNVVTAYQKTGIIGNGDVSVIVRDNTVTGLGPVNYIGQNGIQLGFGALGSVVENNVSGNEYTPQTFASGGILIFSAGNGIRVEDNKVDANDVGIWLNGANLAKVHENVVTGSAFDGIALDDSGGNVQNNRVTQNRASGNSVGIGLYGAAAMNNRLQSNRTDGNGDGIFLGFGTTLNTLLQNQARNNTNDGIWVDSDSNTIQKNQAFGNGNLDIENTGAGNSYSNNRCGTSSGPPVDCPSTNLSSLNALTQRLAPARAAAEPFE
jgi:parallel beta-helix repeat protein